MRMDTSTHDEGRKPDLHPLEIVYEFSQWSYVENLAVRQNGTILVTIFNTGTLMLIDPKGGEDGKATATTVHKFERDISGIVEVEQDVFYVSEGRIGVKFWIIWRVDMNDFSKQSSGYVRRAVDLPHVEFLNGSTVLDKPNRHILVADSYLGEILNVNLGLGTATVWLKNQPVLGKRHDPDFAEKKTEPQVPGVNGIKRHGGYVFFSNTERRIVGRIKIDQPGKKAGEIDIFATHLCADDFVVNDDESLYIATHVFQSVVKVIPRGERTRIAGGQDDQLCAGTTAVAYGPPEEKCLYVTTTGGITNPVGEQPGPGMLLRIKL